MKRPSLDQVPVTSSAGSRVSGRRSSVDVNHVEIPVVVSGANRRRACVRPETSAAYHSGTEVRELDGREPSCCSARCLGTPRRERRRRRSSGRRRGGASESPPADARTGSGTGCAPAASRAGRRTAALGVGLPLHVDHAPAPDRAGGRIGARADERLWRPPFTLTRAIRMLPDQPLKRTRSRRGVQLSPQHEPYLPNVRRRAAAAGRRLDPDVAVTKRSRARAYKGEVAPVRATAGGTNRPSTPRAARSAGSSRVLARDSLTARATELPGRLLGVDERLPVGRRRHRRHQLVGAFASQGPEHVDQLALLASERGHREDRGRRVDDPHECDLPSVGRPGRAQVVAEGAP